MVKRKTKRAAKRTDWKANYAHHAQQNQAFRTAFSRIMDLAKQHETNATNRGLESPDPYVSQVYAVADQMVRMPNP